MAPKQRKSTLARNPRQGSESSSSALPIVPSHIRFHDEKAKTDFFENFQDRGVDSEYQVILSDFADTPFPEIIQTQDWESLLEKPTRCPVMFIQEFYSNIHGIDTTVPQFVTTFRGTCIVVTSDLISEVIRVPTVAHPDYPGCECLQTVFRDDLLSHFCDKPSLWGGALNTPCLGFAKGPHFLNMVMTFDFTPLSHYNSITEPYVRFLLSLIEGLFIEFPSHFIASIIDVYIDIATRDKLIFPSAIMRILMHFSILIPLSSLFTIMGAISVGSIRRSEAQLQSKWPHVEMIDPIASAVPPSFASTYSAPSSFVATGVTLKAIME